MNRTNVDSVDDESRCSLTWSSSCSAGAFRRFPNQSVLVECDYVDGKSILPTGLLGGVLLSHSCKNRKVEVTELTSSNVLIGVIHLSDCLHYYQMVVGFLSHHFWMSMDIGLTKCHYPTKIKITYEPKKTILTVKIKQHLPGSTVNPIFSNSTAASSLSPCCRLLCRCVVASFGKAPWSQVPHAKAW